MDHEAHVGLVDAHAEGDRRANHPHLVAQEKLLVLRALGGRQPGVIRPGLHAVLAQPLGDALGRLARLAIDDAAFPGPVAQELQHLLVGLVLGQHAVGQVRPVEAGHVATRLAQLQQRDDVLAHALGGRGGQRHHRAPWERAARSSASWRYSGRKSCPHSLMQCASSTASRFTPHRCKSDRNPDSISRSGAA